MHSDPRHTSFRDLKKKCMESATFVLTHNLFDCVTVCNCIINVLDSPFASSVAIYIDKYVSAWTNAK